MRVVQISQIWIVPCAKIQSRILSTWYIKDLSLNFTFKNIIFCHHCDISLHNILPGLCYLGKICNYFSNPSSKQISLVSIHKSFCFFQLSDTVTKYLRKSTQRKGLFWLWFQKFQSMQAVFIQACDEAVYHGRERKIKKSCSSHGQWEEKSKKSGLGFPCSL